MIIVSLFIGLMLYVIVGFNFQPTASFEICAMCIIQCKQKDLIERNIKSVSLLPYEIAMSSFLLLAPIGLIWPLLFPSFQQYNTSAKCFTCLILTKLSHFCSSMWFFKNIFHTDPSIIADSGYYFSYISMYQFWSGFNFYITKHSHRNEALLLVSLTPSPTLNFNQLEPQCHRKGQWITNKNTSKWCINPHHCFD